MHKMSLLGGPLLVLSVLLAIAAPIACLLLWSRLGGPQIVRISGRIGLIALCQCTALMLAGLLVNRSFQLYASWADLFGNDGDDGGQFHQADPGDPGHGGKGGINAKFTFDTDHQLWGATVTGPASGIHSMIRVWLPPQYTLPQYKNTKFPVIELFPGFPGSPTTWFSAMQGGDMLLASMKTGRAKPYILVAPVMTVQPGRDTECTDIPGGPRVGTWLTKDVRAVVTQYFRAIPSADSWGTMGYSTGGFCAAKLTLQYPQMFRAGVSLSGYFAPTSPDLTRNPNLLRANSPFDLIGLHRPVSLLLTGTDQDPGTADGIARMTRAVKSPTKIFVFIALRGGHNVGVWQRMLPRAYEWLSQQLSGPGNPST